MNILKILKVYLVFILIITAVSAVSYTKPVKGYFDTYFASVLHSNKATKVVSYDLSSLVEEKKETFIDPATNPGHIEFRITKNPEAAFALPGDISAEIMQMNFAAEDQDLEIRGLKFKIANVEPEYIEAGYLVDGEEIVAAGRVAKEYLRFDHVSYQIKAGESAALTVRLDLNDSLEPNDRIRLDIENPDDASLLLDGKRYYLSGYYPIKGRYLTIVKPRAWSKTLWLPEEALIE